MPRKSIRNNYPLCAIKWIQGVIRLFKVGDLVTSDLYGDDIIFCIMDFKTGQDGSCVAVLKGLYNKTLLADAPLSSLTNMMHSGRL